MTRNELTKLWAKITNLFARKSDLDSLQSQIEDITPNQIESIVATPTSTGNTVTITESNGTVTNFNVENGEDGVSLGEIALSQTTGDATDKVMSQKAITYAPANDIVYSPDMCFRSNNNDQFVSLKKYNILDLFNVMVIVYSIQTNGINHYSSPAKYILALRKDGSNLIGVKIDSYILKIELIKDGSVIQTVSVGNIGTLGIRNRCSYGIKIDLYNKTVNTYTIADDALSVADSTDISQWDLSGLNGDLQILTCASIYAGVINNIRLFINNYFNIESELTYQFRESKYNSQSIWPKTDIEAFPVTDFRLGGTVSSTISTTHKISDVNLSNAYLALGPYIDKTGIQYLVKFKITSGTCSLSVGVGQERVYLFDANFNYLSDLNSGYYELTNDTVYYVYVRVLGSQSCTYTCMYGVRANGQFTIETLDCVAFTSQCANICAETYNGSVVKGTIPMEAKTVYLVSPSINGDSSTSGIPLFTIRNNSGKVQIWNGSAWKQINNS